MALFCGTNTSDSRLNLCEQLKSKNYQTPNSLGWQESTGKTMEKSVSNKHILRVTHFFQWRDGFFQETNPNSKGFQLVPSCFPHFCPQILEQKTSQATTGTWRTYTSLSKQPPGRDPDPTPPFPSSTVGAAKEMMFMESAAA